MLNLGVPGESTLRHAVTCPDLHTRANSLHTLLSRHRLPSCDDFDDNQGTGKPVFNDDDPECLPPSQLRYSSELLHKLHTRLNQVSLMFAPCHERTANSFGPTKEDTERIKERLSALSERSRLYSSASRNFSKTTHLDYMAKFLLRPVNEILSCMLLCTGLQIFWQLTPDPLSPDGSSRFELIYSPANHPDEAIAFMELTTPAELPDSAMRILVDSLRCQLLKVDHQGQVVVATPLPPSHRSASCKLVGKVVRHMLATNTPVGIITNCNRFMVVNNRGPNVRGEENIEFSDLVNGTDIPGEMLTESPLGLLLGLTVFALHRRGLSLRASYGGLLEHATTVSLLRSFLADRFGKVDKRRSQEIRLKRRAMFELGMYPSQLGPSSVLFRLPDDFDGAIAAKTRELVSSFVNTFHGPSHMDVIPNLIPETYNEAWFIPELELHGWRGNGDLWEVFTARFSWLRWESAEADLIVKFCNLQGFEEEPKESYLYSRDDARIAMRAEIIAYKGPLAPLQGDIVPQFYGLLGSWQPGSNQCWCALFEDAGVNLTPGDGIDPNVRGEIRRMYKKLHEHGVLHTDIGWRHILRGKHGLKLVSFDRAIMRRSETDEEWARKCKTEMDALDELLGEGTWSPTVPEPDVGAEDDATTLHPNDSESNCDRRSYLVDPPDVDLGVVPNAPSIDDDASWHIVRGPVVTRDDDFDPDDLRLPALPFAPEPAVKTISRKSSLRFLAKLITPKSSLTNIKESAKKAKVQPRFMTPEPRRTQTITPVESPASVKNPPKTPKPPRVKITRSKSTDDLTEKVPLQATPFNTPEKSLLKRASQLLRFHHA